MQTLTFSVSFGVGLFLLHIVVNKNTANVLPTGVDSTNEIEASGEGNICGTEACEKEATAMLNSLDANINPCDNFYEFACGNFIRKTILPKDKTIIMSFTQVQDKVEEQLRSILREEPQPNESKPFRLAKTFNLACLNETATNEMGRTIRFFYQFLCII